MPALFKLYNMEQVDYARHYELAADSYDQDSLFDMDGEENSFFDEDSEQANNFDEVDSFDDEPDNLFGIAIGKKARRKKALKKSRATLAYEREDAAIQNERQAIANNLTPAAVAYQQVERNVPIISEYVQNQGQIPQTNPAALALQATQLFQNQVAQKQYYIPDYNSAHDSVIDDEQQNWENADEFFGSIISSVFEAGKGLITAINQKREANGKKPLFAGKNWQALANKVNNNQSVINDALTANEIAFLQLTKSENQKAYEQTILGKTQGAFMSYQQNEAIKKWLPFVLIGIVGYIVINKK